ncbi:Nucleolar protein 10 [Linum grandiflorum]
MATQGGNLKSTTINGVKTYTISQRNLPSWITPNKKRALRKDPNYQQRVELIQDLRFETATSRIKITPNGEYVIASGIYPPQVKVYELRELSMKFERHFESEIIDFQILDEDYSKLAFLCADRSVCLHAKYGKHYSLRIPRMGRDIEYDCWSCDLFCAASSPDLYRINLEQGRFLPSLNTRSPALNVVSRSKIHGLVACGGEDGAVECFDMRVKGVARIDAVAPSGDIDQEVTALEFDEDGGFLMAVGSSGGKVLLYDLRSSNPVRVKDHLYGSRILDIKWHHSLNSEGRKLITTDSHIVRIWDPETGEGMTSIEPNGGTINDICVFKNSGLMFLALDGSQIPSYFIPSLGPAPKWIASLENLTEELEEDGQTAVYDNFKFLTKEDLERLNMTKYIGTNHLRAYMHGFFVDLRLYQREKAKADPFEYDIYLDRRKEEKLEELRTSRITKVKRLPKVNRSLAVSILEKEIETERKDEDGFEKRKGSKKSKGLGSEIFDDPRFSGKMFNNEDFEIDETSPEYLALHPMASSTKQPSSFEEHFEPIAGDGEQDFSSSDEEPDTIKGKSRVPRLYEVKDERHAEAFRNNVSLAVEDSLPMGERIASLGEDGRNSGIMKNVKFGPGGSREISYIPRGRAKFREDNEDKDDREEGGPGRKRGVDTLGLKKDGAEFKGQGRGRGSGRGRGRRGRGRGNRGGRGRG